MNTLLGYLAEQDGSRPAVVTPTATISLGDILARAHTLRDRGGLASGAPAVANGGDAAGFVETLAGYEGWVETLYLQPAGTLAPQDAAVCPARPLPMRSKRSGPQAAKG